jgi:hypothetical protein
VSVLLVMTKASQALPPDPTRRSDSDAHPTGGSILFTPIGNCLRLEGRRADLTGNMLLDISDQRGPGPWGDAAFAFRKWSLSWLRKSSGSGC